MPERCGRPVLTIGSGSRNLKVLSLWGKIVRIKVNDIQINYELSGKKNAEVVVLSHSLSSSLTMWTPQMDALNAYFQVLRYDIRGHGGSDAPSKAYTLELLAQDVIGLLDALDIGRVNFVGLSLGGMIGQSLVLKDPNRLQSLTLCDTAALVPAEAQPLWQERIDKARKQGMAVLLDQTMERWFSPSYVKQNSKMLLQIREQLLATPVSGYIGCAEAIRRLEYLDRLSQIKVPTLIMVGEEDPGTPVSAAKAMYERIPNSKLVIIPSARHLSNVEQAEAFNTALLKFLKELKSSS